MVKRINRHNNKIRPLPAGKPIKKEELWDLETVVSVLYVFISQCYVFLFRFVFLVSP